MFELIYSFILLQGGLKDEKKTKQGGYCYIPLEICRETESIEDGGFFRYDKEQRL